METVLKQMDVSQFLRQYDSRNTQLSLKTGLKQFFKLMYSESKEDLDALSMRYLNEERDFRGDIIQFKESLKGKAPKTIVARLNAIRVFLSDNEIMFPNRFFKTLNGKSQEAISEEEMPTKAKLKKLLDYMPLQGKAFTMFLVSTGCRGGEASQIRIDEVDWESDVPKVKIRGAITKTGKKRITFITPETKELLQEWLRFRPQYIEQARQRGAFKRKSEYEYEGLLFPFTAKNFGYLWRNTLKKAGLLKTDSRTGWTTLKPHTLRKFFRVMVGRHGRDEAECLMGHQTGLNRIYARFIGEAGERRLEEIYRKAIPDLSIRETQDVSDVLERIEIKATEKDRQIQALEQQLGGLRARTSKVEELEKQISKLQKEVQAKNNLLRARKPIPVGEIEESLQNQIAKLQEEQRILNDLVKARDVVISTFYDLLDEDEEVRKKFKERYLKSMKKRARSRVNKKKS